MESMYNQEKNRNRTKMTVDETNRRSQECGIECNGTIKTAGVVNRMDEEPQASDS